MNDTRKHSENTEVLEEGNTKTSSKRLRKWCFTLNNYSEEDYEKILNYVKHKKHTKYIIGKEVGKNGTPHLQGYINSKSAISFDTLKNICNSLHLEKAVASDEKNYIYCSKENNYTTNIQEDRKRKFLNHYKNVEWYDWQKKILELCAGKPDDRKINWVVDFGGNKGKSFLTKYLYLIYNCIIADGKKDNVFNQIHTFYEPDNNNGKEIDLVLLDIPRHNENYVNYGMLEQIKNGLVFSGKYEGGCHIFNSPHLIVFANFEPDLNKFSRDRWNIINLEDDPLGSN